MSFSGRVADEAGACAEGAPSIKCVLPAILHLYIKERAADSLRVARYEPAKLGGLAAARAGDGTYHITGVEFSAVKFS